MMQNNNISELQMPSRIKYISVAGGHHDRTLLSGNVDTRMLVERKPGIARKIAREIAFYRQQRRPMRWNLAISIFGRSQKIATQLSRSIFAAGGQSHFRRS